MSAAEYAVSRSQYNPKARVFQLAVAVLVLAGARLGFRHQQSPMLAAESASVLALAPGLARWPVWVWSGLGAVPALALPRPWLDGLGYRDRESYRILYDGFGYWMRPVGGNTPAGLLLLPLKT